MKMKGLHSQTSTPYIHVNAWIRILDLRVDNTIQEGSSKGALDIHETDEVRKQEERESYTDDGCRTVTVSFDVRPSGGQTLKLKSNGAMTVFCG